MIRQVFRSSNREATWTLECLTLNSSLPRRPVLKKPYYGLSLLTSMLIRPEQHALYFAPRRMASTSSGNKGPGRAFVEAFRDSVQRQIKENKDLQTDIKLLSSETSKLTESESLRKARQVMEKESSAIKIKASKVVHAAVSIAADSAVGRATKTTIEATSRVVEAAAQPIVDSRVYKSVSTNMNRAIHSCGGRYGGFASLEHRNSIRERRAYLYKQRYGGMCEPNTDATAVAKVDKSTQSSTAASGMYNIASRVKEEFCNAYKRAGQAVEGTENLAILWGRWAAQRVQNCVGGVFEETETARAIGRIKAQDRWFNFDSFLSDVREFVVPELLTAWIVGDREVLKQWCDEAPYARIMSGHAELSKQGFYNDSSIFELQNVDITSAKQLENDVAVLVVTFQTQENIVYKSVANGKIELGKEDHIMLCSYALILTYREEWLDEVTHGWRIIDAAKHASGSIL